MKKFALLASFVVLTLAATVDISNAVYESIMTLNNTSSTAQEDVTAEFNISGHSLVDSGFMSADTLDAAVAEGSTLVRSQPPSDRIRMLGCVQSDSGTTTAYTTECNSSTADDVPLLPSGGPEVGDAFYFGADWPYRILPIDVSTPATEDWGNGDWEYWNGDWTEHSNVADNTELFTNSGVRAVSWDTPRDWEKTTVDGTEAYWTRLNVTEVSATTTDPLASTVEWETGMWWTFTESLSGQEQKQYTLALGGSDMVDNHAFFPGEEGYVTADAAALEPGSDNFEIEIIGFISTDAASTTPIYLEKENAIKIDNPSPQTLRLTINGSASSTVSGIPSAEHTMTLTGDGSSAVLAIEGENSTSVSYAGIDDTANDWQWGSESKTPYINSLEYNTPTVDTDDSTADWGAGTLTDVEADSGNLQLQEDGTDVETCSTQVILNVTLSSDGNCYINANSANAVDGNNTLILEGTGGTDPRVGSGRVSVAGSTTYSILLNCESLGSFSANTSIRVTYRDSGGSIISTDTTSSGTCIVGSGMAQLDVNITTPSNAATAEVQFEGDDNRELEVDCWLFLEGNVSPSCPGDGFENLFETSAVSFSEVNWSFEQIFPFSGNRISPDFDVSSVTEVVSSSVTWGDNSDTVSASTTATYEVTLDAEATWQEVESSGDPIPGISPGDDLSGQTPLRSRVTLENADGTETVLVDVLTLQVLGANGQVLVYRPQERIGLSLTDETGSGNDATSSFPTASIDSITTDMSALQGTGNVTIEDIQTQPEVIPQQSSTQSFLEGGTGSSLPFHDIFAAFSTESGIPVLAFWVTAACVVILMVGVAVARFAQSSAAAVFAMVFTALMFTQLGTNGILPMWVLLFFAISAGGSLLAARGMRI